jgi:hypothetical protein
MHLENEKILFMLFCTELETAPDVNHLSWMTLSGYKKKSAPILNLYGSTKWSVRAFMDTNFQDKFQTIRLALDRRV